MNTKYDIDKTKEYYNNIASKYDNTGLYPANYYRRMIVMSYFKSSRNINRDVRGNVLDAGCGTGKVLEDLFLDGYHCYGIDISEKMISQANKKLNIPNHLVPLYCDNMNDLSMFNNNTFDYIICLGVLPYIPEDEEIKVYKEFKRVIKPHGTLITAHQNELFSLFSFNKYTIEFIRKNILSLTENGNDYMNEIKALLTNADEPVNINKDNSARDIIFTKSENPLTYANKLLKHGFESVRYDYYNMHSVPPLIRNTNMDLLNSSIDLEFFDSTRWQSMFIASTFINFAVAI